jgi:glycosyltransferase involved in cell wall biosynthesis
MCRDYFTALATHILTTTRTPVVAQTHGMLGPPPSFAMKAYDLVITRHLLPLVETFLFLTEAEREGLLRLGVSRERLRPIDNACRQPPHRWSDPSRPVFVFASRLHSRKQPIVFVEAAMDLLSDGADMNFSIVGPDQGEEETVRNRINESNYAARFSFFGGMNHENLMQLLSESTAMVLPSIDEPYPMIVIEALSMGVPAVVTNCTGIRSRLKSAGAAALVEPNSNEISETLSRISLDEGWRQELSMRGRFLYESVWQPQALSARLETYYNEVTRRRRDS